MVTAAVQEGEILLGQAQKLVSQVILASGSVKAFLVRWKTLNAKLEKLSGLLIELGGLPFYSKNTLCKEMLESLVGSLQECSELVSECSTPDYGGGKLQMQSRLDSLGNLLDGFLHDSRLMIESGVLRQTLPLMTVSVTGVSKESRKWTVKDLLARLQLGSSESRAKALDSLVEFMCEDDKNVLLVAATPGGIPALVHLLDARVPVMREKAAAAVSSLATVESCVHQIVSEGALQSLVRLLDPARGSVGSERAARGLQSLTAMPDNARAVAAHGGIPPLLELCRTGTPASQAASAGVLRNLAAVEEIRGRIADEEDGVQVLIHLLSSGTPQTRDHAAVTLQKLASGGEDVRRVLIWNEVLEGLARFLDGAAEAPASLEAGLGLLRSLAAWDEAVPAILEAGFIPQLAGFLTHGVLSVQQSAAGVVGEIAGVSSENRRVVGEAGCIGPLLRMLQAKTQAAQEDAMVVLAKLVEVESNRRLLAAEEGGIEAVVRVLESESATGVAMERAVAAMGTLAGNSRNRKQMVASGACYHLRRAGDLDVAGAKKLLERLEGGRLRSFLKKTLDI